MSSVVIREGAPMACDVPRPRWFAGMIRPLSAVLCTAGLLCTVAGVITTGGLTATLTPVGAILFLVGTSNGAVSALNLGSVLQLANGSRARIDSLTKECAAMQSMMENVAQALCSDTSAAQRAVSLTITRASREWTGGVGPPFPSFLLCRTITVAREQDVIFGDGTATAPERERKVILVLHNLCDVPVADIAVMLDRDITDIRAGLTARAREASR